MLFRRPSSVARSLAWARHLLLWNTSLICCNYLCNFSPGSLTTNARVSTNHPRIILRYDCFASARNFECDSSSSLGKDLPFEVSLSRPTMWSAIGIAAALFALSQP